MTELTKNTDSITELVPPNTEMQPVTITEIPSLIDANISDARNFYKETVTDSACEISPLDDYRNELSAYKPTLLILNNIYLLHGVSSKDQLFAVLGEEAKKVMRCLIVGDLPCVGYTFEPTISSDTIFDTMEEHLLGINNGRNKSVSEYLERLTYSLKDLEPYHKIIASEVTSLLD